MSGHGFHVHGPHDHEIEHAVQGGHNSGGMINQIAMFTAIIATVGALFSYMGGATQAHAGLFKNNAAVKKTEASNQWNFYQSKSTKQALAELARDLSPEAKQATEWDHQSDKQMHQHHRWAQATTVLQVAIALAAIALLTKKKWLEYAMFGAGGLGVVVGGLAALHL
jgi:hypothetical protein